jgi:hypothetical protein
LLELCEPSRSKLIEINQECVVQYVLPDLIARARKQTVLGLSAGFVVLPGCYFTVRGANQRFRMRTGDGYHEGDRHFSRRRLAPRPYMGASAATLHRLKRGTRTRSVSALRTALGQEWTHAPQQRTSLFDHVRVSISFKWQRFQPPSPPGLLCWPANGRSR